MDATVLITRPHGHNALPYVVAQITVRWMRITHVIDLGEARIVAADWERLDYSFNAGSVRQFGAPPL